MAARASCLQLVDRRVDLGQAVEVGLHALRHARHAEHLRLQLEALRNLALDAQFVLGAMNDDSLQRVDCGIVDVIVPAGHARAARHELALVVLGIPTLAGDDDLIVLGDRDGVRANRINRMVRGNREHDAIVVVQVVGAAELDGALVAAVVVREGIEGREHVEILGAPNLHHLGVGVQVALQVAHAMVLELLLVIAVQLEVQHDLRVLLVLLGNLVRSGFLHGDVGGTQVVVHGIADDVLMLVLAVVVLAELEAGVDVGLRQGRVLQEGK